MTIKATSRLVSGFCAFLLAMSCTVRCAAQDQAAHPELLVSTQWLADHLHDPKVVVLQVGDDRGDYDKGHIPGTRFLASKDHIVGHVGLMVELPPAEKLKESFENLGVSDDTRVVIYTTEWYPSAGRAFFTLDYLGHENTALLDGSLAQWKRENRPVDTATPQVAKGKITPRVNEAVRALLDDARRATDPGAQTLLVDSRPQRRYVAGHLPGADHIFWEETVNSPKDPVFLSPADLRKLFASRGITPGHKLITYCEIGLQASHMYFVAKYLGYDAAMFDGSFYQWNDLEHLPVVKGSSPR